jgi:hypothetical protein
MSLAPFTEVTDKILVNMPECYTVCTVPNFLFIFWHNVSELYTGSLKNVQHILWNGLISGSNLMKKIFIQDALILCDGQNFWRYGKFVPV